MQELQDIKRDIVGRLFKNSILVSAEKINSLSHHHLRQLKDLLAQSSQLTDQTIIDFMNSFSERPGALHPEVPAGRATAAGPSSPGDRFMSINVTCYKEKPAKTNIQDFVSYFNTRYRTLEKFLRNRPQLENLMSVSRIISKQDYGRVSLIGMISDKRLSKNGNLIITTEDPTGMIKFVVRKDNLDLFSIANNLVFDDVVGVSGSNKEKIIFADTIILPDIPLNKEVKKSPVEEYALFLSDLHVGSSLFLAEDFDRFIKWINQETGSDAQKEIASKVKYIFIIGDLVDGIGIYGAQEHELAIPDIYDQYKECAALLSKIPSHIPLIICPGNHDAVRISEPQPVLPMEFAEPIYMLPNVLMVTNPSIINIGATGEFPGFDVLMYHGYSFDFYADAVEEIRSQQPNISDRAGLVMQFLLKRRHLAPTHESTLRVVDPIEDPLVINNVPDFFIAGHIHKCATLVYRNVILICGSCWQSKTPFQERVGHKPEPGKVPVVNLKTRQIKVLNFKPEG